MCTSGQSDPRGLISALFIWLLERIIIINPVKISRVLLLFVAEQVGVSFIALLIYRDSKKFSIKMAIFSNPSV